MYRNLRFRVRGHTVWITISYHVGGEPAWRSSGSIICPVRVVFPEALHVCREAHTADPGRQGDRAPVSSDS